MLTIRYSIIIAIILFCNLLAYNCEQMPPTDYKHYIACLDTYQQNYYIGESSMKEANYKTLAKDDMSRKISSYVVSNRTLSNNDIIENISEEAAQFLTDLNSTSFIKDGDKYKTWFYFQDKEKLRQIVSDINTQIIKQADQLYNKWLDRNANPYDRYDSLIKAVLLVNAITGFGLLDKEEKLLELASMRNTIMTEFDRYIDGIRFYVSQFDAGNITVGVPTNKTVSVQVSVSSNNHPIPPSVFIQAESEMDGKGWDDRNRKYKQVEGVVFSFELGTFKSYDSNQTILFYPKIKDKYSFVGIPESQIITARNILEKNIIGKAEAGVFKGNLNVTVSTKYSLSFNERSIRQKLKRDLKLRQDDIDWLIEIIKKAINDPDMNTVYDKSSENKVKIEFIISGRNRSQGTLNFGENIKVGWRKSADRSFNLISNRPSYNTRLKQYVKDQIIETTRELTKTRIVCQVCEKDRIVLTDKNNKKISEYSLPNQQYISYEFDKGQLNKIEIFPPSKLFRRSEPYLTIDGIALQQSLKDSYSQSLSDILKRYYKDKAYVTDKILQGGVQVCYPLDDTITYNLLGINDDLSNYTITWDRGIVNTRYIKANNNEDHYLSVKRNGYDIRLQTDNNKVKNKTLKINSEYTIKPERNIIVTSRPSKITYSYYLIPGRTNLRLKQADRFNSLVGGFKMLLFAYLVKDISYNYNQYSDYRDGYNNYQNQYNSLVDGSQEQYNNLRDRAQDNYDMMIDFQDKQNLSLSLLGALYLQNTFEIFRLKKSLK